MPIATPPTLAEIMAKTRPLAKTGCRLWTRTVNTMGVPYWKREQHQFNLRRRVYDLAHGGLLANWVVDVTCRDPKCLEPTHLTMARKASALRPLVGVPLPKGESLRSAGYLLVQRPQGQSVWEPADVANAIWDVTRPYIRCDGCGEMNDKRARKYCNKKCRERAVTAAKAKARAAARV